MENKKSNILGIIGLCTGWLVPISGIVLGIIALARKEPNSMIGVLSICEGAVFWALYYAMIL